MLFKKRASGVLSASQMKQLVADCHLSHIAFIMDGNGRWATRRGLPREAGHRQGAKVFRDTVSLCRDWGIETVTAYAFSTENWKRPKNEVSEIMRLLDSYISEAEDDNEKNKIRYVFLGDKSRLEAGLREKCEYLEKISRENHLTLNIALNYGGRDEILHAVNSLIDEGRRDITEADISSHLYTAESPDPDLIVRTSGEYRISNFLLWQSAYSEYYFAECMWPELDEKELQRAIIDFSKRGRRFGNVK